MFSVLSTAIKPETYTGDQLIARVLAAEATDVVFCGTDVTVLAPAFAAIPLRTMNLCQEQAAVHAASGYARTTGQAGVIVVTSGSGVANMIVGLTNALTDSVPLVCITIQESAAPDVSQDSNTMSITRGCTKYNYLVTDPEELGHILHEAFYIARTGRPGPVVVDIPYAILQDTASYAYHSGIRASYQPQTSGDVRLIENAVQLMATAERPIFYVGGGVINAGEDACDALRELVHLTGFPCAHTLMGLGAFPSNDPQCLGLLSVDATHVAAQAMAQSDVIISVGAGLNEQLMGRAGAFSPQAKKIHIDIDPSAINKNIKAQIPIIGDAGVIVSQLIDVWKRRDIKPDEIALAQWWQNISAWREQSTQIDPPVGLTLAAFFERLAEVSAAYDTYVTADTRAHQYAVAHHLPFDVPQRWVISGGLAVPGFGLPAAIGAQVAHPHALVMAITDRASLLKHLEELSTLAQQSLPIKIFCLQEQAGTNAPSIVALAEAFGIKALRCNKAEELNAVLAYKGPIVVEVYVQKQDTYEHE